MRHARKTPHLSRPKGAREALLIGLAQALIRHKAITTTLPKAKALRPFIEPILSKAKVDSMHHRRYVFARLRHKAPVKLLFGQIASTIADRPGGYTRIIKLERRSGDSAPMARIELVDYNHLYKAKEDKPTAGRRRKRSKAAANTQPQTAVEDSTKTPQPQPAPQGESSGIN